MKTLVLVVTASLATALVAANAAPGTGCTQILRNLNASAAAITQNANSYWQHRANYVDLNFGQRRRTDPNARANSGQEKSQGDALRAAMPNSLASFKGQVAAAQAQNCLSPAQLSEITEPAIKFAKRVNFDKFPEEEEPIESTVNPGPPRMPTK